ncbi:AAA family ATPase [Stieleria varia]|uniref:Chromosome segregation protein n=1 Tax=Stieleria varia TaxID=2528005 RepID=A0A5C6AMH5_9BACT|nr:hypothetical protein [Stieleria varia]TWU00860.1 chromosome segregation protein [Stieleria varia]
MIRSFIAPVALTVCCLLCSSVFAGIPGSLPQTAAVYRDLAGLKSECDRTIQMAVQLREATRSARKSVDQSIDVTKAINAMDKRLVKLIDRLKPYASVPKVRTVARTLSKNLQRIQTQLHSLRLKTDRCEQEVLRPTQKRLQDLEQSLAGAEHKLRGLKRDIDEKMTQLDQAAQVAQHTQFTRQVLESTAQTLRQATSVTLNAVRQTRQQMDGVGYKLQSLNQYASKFRTVGNSLNDMDRKMRTPEEMVAKLDQAIGKRLTIKIPFSKKSVSFTIRQILEKPGEVMNVVLKPLEKLADGILQPILGKMNLEIQSPKGLQELEQQLASLGSFQVTLGSVCDGLVRQLGTRIDQEIARLRAVRITIPTTPRLTQRQRDLEPVVQPVEQPIAKDKPAKRTQPAMFITFGP